MTAPYSHAFDRTHRARCNTRAGEMQTRGNTMRSKYNH